MGRTLIILLLLLGDTCIQASAQQAATYQSIPEQHCSTIDAMAAYIKEREQTDTGRIAAIHQWVTNNISYDLARMKAMKDQPGAPRPSATDVLKKRSGVCQDYAALYVALCEGVNIDAHQIGGYTKNKTGIAELSHAWVAAFVNNKWLLFDPTWDAGAVRDNHFIKKPGTRYFKVAPAQFIADHMPYDPLNQLLPYILTHQEFINGKPAASTVMFNYADSLEEYKKLDKTAQARAELRRLLAAGTPHTLLQERSSFLKNVIQASASKNSFDEGLVHYRAAVSAYKEIIQHRNAKFTTIADADLRLLLSNFANDIKEARELVQEAVPKTDAQWTAKTRQLESIIKLSAQFVQHKDFANKYLTTPADKRAQLFAK
ncbi:MAG: transglutaminase domain-containing protein [Chitinophagaceae bacterium]|nr:MAG: transglutaminase domain-containing protein [Chitinophagaceae bacterium]